MIRGQTTIPNYSIEAATYSQKSVCSTERLRIGLHANDPMNIDSNVIHTLSKGEVRKQPVLPSVMSPKSLTSQFRRYPFP